MNYIYKCTNKECKNCDIEFNVEKSMKDERIETCEYCDNEVKRVWKPTNFIWKCGGDYNSTRK